MRMNNYNGVVTSRGSCILIRASNFGSTEQLRLTYRPDPLYVVLYDNTYVHLGLGTRLKKLHRAVFYGDQCCREILFLFNRLFRDTSRNEDLIAMFISRYIINIYYQL